MSRPRPRAAALRQSRCSVLQHAHAHVRVRLRPRDALRPPLHVRAQPPRRVPAPRSRARRRVLSLRAPQPASPLRRACQRRVLHPSPSLTPWPGVRARARWSRQRASARAHARRRTRDREIGRMSRSPPPVNRQLARRRSSPRPRPRATRSARPAHVTPDGATCLPRPAARPQGHPTRSRRPGRPVMRARATAPSPARRAPSVLCPSAASSQTLSAPRARAPGPRAAPLATFRKTVCARRALGQTVRRRERATARDPRAARRRCSALQPNPPKLCPRPAPELLDRALRLSRHSIRPFARAARPGRLRDWWCAHALAAGHRRSRGLLTRPAPRPAPRRATPRPAPWPHAAPPAARRARPHEKATRGTHRRKLRSRAAASAGGSSPARPGGLRALRGRRARLSQHFDRDKPRRPDAQGRGNTAQDPRQFGPNSG